jgi:hypothetical protein
MKQFPGKVLGFSNLDGHWLFVFRTRLANVEWDNQERKQDDQEPEQGRSLPLQGLIIRVAQDEIDPFY